MKLVSIAQYKRLSGLSHTTIQNRIESGEITATKDPQGMYKSRLIDIDKFPPSPRKKRGVKPYRNDNI